LLGDIQLANGIIQPFFNVSKRRYRFRVLNGGPSRFYELFLTDPLSPSTVIPFWVIANDGNLLPKPIQVTSFRLSVAERYDIIIDFNQVKNLIGSHTKVRLENRLEQKDGQGPECNVFAGGDHDGTYCVEFRIGAAVADNSVDPATQPSFYALPSVIAPRITRNFEFDRDNGQWIINEKFANCNDIRFTVTQNSAENWVLINPRDDWQHPIHIHLEEHQILSRVNSGGHHSSRSGDTYGDRGDCNFGGGGGGISTTRPGVPKVEVSRKDVTRLQFDEDATIFFRFRDFRGDWPMHCHNTVHEDHAMMLLFEVQPGVIDNDTDP
jgi:FtsP/CotA-like multicopper oxidase with cupredoxin domain